MSRKTVITLLLSIMFFTSLTYAINADYYISTGRGLMFNGTLSGLRLAYQTFDNGLNDPSCEDCCMNRELIFLHAISRITMWTAKDDGEPIDSAIELAREFGIEILGDDFWTIDISYPNDLEPEKNQHDAYIIPEGSREILNKIRDFLKTAAIAEFDSVLDELDAIWDTPEDPFRVFFTPDETQVFFGPNSLGLQNNVEIDYAEVMILKAMLKSLKALIETQMAYDLYVDENDMFVEKYYDNCFNINSDLLDPHPDFLNVLPTANDSNDGPAILAQAAEDLISSINYYLDMVGYIRSEQDSQDDDLLCIDPNDDNIVNKISDRLTAFRDSLINDTTITTPLATTKTYALEDINSSNTWDLKLIFNSIGFDAGGSFALVTGSNLPSPWEITDFSIEGHSLIAEMDYDMPGYWGGGWFQADISQDCNTITNGIFEYWGVDYGTISDLSGQITNIDIEEENLDLNPVFGNSQRYPTPVNPRDLIPVLDQWNKPLPGTMGFGLGGDPTLGGILPNMTQYDWQKRLNLQPAGLIYLSEIKPYQKTEGYGYVGWWFESQLVFQDIASDTSDDSNQVSNMDIDRLYMGYDFDGLYGTITLNDYNNVDDSIYKFYNIYLSYSPDDISSLDTIRLEIKANSGYATGTIYQRTNSYGYSHWDDMGSFNARLGHNGIDFWTYWCYMPYYLPGRFVSLKTGYGEDYYYYKDSEENKTHIKIGEVGNITGTVTYDGYKGDPIYIHAYTDPRDPQGSLIASTMITEPGQYTLEGIGLGWQGYVMAFTPLFGFDNPFELDAFDIQAAVPVFMGNDDLTNIDIDLHYPVVLEKNIWQSGEIDPNTQNVNWYTFDAVQGGNYVLDLDQNGSNGLSINLYGRDGDNELIQLPYWQNQQINWLCPLSGRYYIKVVNGYEDPQSRTYQLRMTTDITCPDTDIASAEGIGVKDRKVDYYDLTALVSRWRNSCSSPHWCDGADFNQSSLVDFEDFAILAKHWLENATE